MYDWYYTNAMDSDSDRTTNSKNLYGCVLMSCTLGIKDSCKKNMRMSDNMSWPLCANWGAWSMLSTVVLKESFKYVCDRRGNSDLINVINTKSDRRATVKWPMLLTLSLIGSCNYVWDRRRNSEIVNGR